MGEEVEVYDRYDLILRIRIAEAISLFDDVRENFQRLIQNYGKELTTLERNAFAVFYKRLLDKFRKEYNLYMDLQQQIPRREILKHRILRDNMYRARYEVITICKEVIDMIDNSILDTENIELKVYFLKLRADYYRYWSTTVSNDRFYDLHNRAEESYQLALKLATKKLRRFHPLRLGVMLNLSIHYYRVPYDRIKAIQLSMQAVTEGKYYVDFDPDIRTAVELLQDNLDLWMSNLGPREVHELEMLEGARKWHGKKAAVPSIRLLRHLSGEPNPKFEPPIVPRKRYFTMPQSLNHYSFYDDAPKYDANVIYEQIFKPKTPSSTKFESATAKSDDSAAKLEITQTPPQITTSITTTSSTILARTELQMTTTVENDPNFTKTPQPTLPEISFYSTPQEESASYKEHESDKEHVPDPFEGILQPLLLSSWSSSTSSSSTTISQQLGEDSDDDNGHIEQTEYRPSILQVSEPRDIPHPNEPSPTTIEPISELTKRLRSFESRMLAIRNRQLRLEESEAGEESEGEHAATEQESDDEDEQPDEGNDSAANRESRISPNIVAPISSLHIVTSEVSAPLYTHITSKVGVVRELQTQSQNIPADRIGDSRNVELQQHFTIFSKQPSTSYQIDLSAQQQQQQSSSETEQMKPSGAFEHLVFSEPKPPTPPPSSKAYERLIFPDSKPPTSPPLVIFTPYGPKIAHFSPIPWLEGATAPLSPSSSVKKKRVTFSDECTYWPPQSRTPLRTFARFSGHRLGQRSRQRSSRPPPPSLSLVSPEQSPERGQHMPRSSRNYSNQQAVAILQYDATPHQVFFYPQQVSGQKQQLGYQRRKLAQRKLLRRSFSAPREGATWPISSLARESPYFIYSVLRRASAPSGQAFGRRFLSAHSSAEDLYDEAAEKAFPDPWAPRGARTMRNTFPIIPWYPKEEPRVPWIPFQWPYRRTIRE
ncbi:14-3-3 family protein [Acanthocheilonema viteae]|uniref:14-3-3 domain-containing protein n=1 Tax=Acanthocheilonema viteae TaxID=6277 RepID=A0A498SC85_ACAVI|nr:unnamed protein product [Acanthocheilonema viteae]